MSILLTEIIIISTACTRFQDTIPFSLPATLVPFTLYSTHALLLLQLCMPSAHYTSSSSPTLPLLWCVLCSARPSFVEGLSNWEGQDQNCYCSAPFCASLTPPSPPMGEQISTTLMTPQPMHFLHQVAANLPLNLSRPVLEPQLASHLTAVCHMLSSRCVRCFGSISWVRRRCVRVSCEVDSMFLLPLLSSTLM